MEVQPLPALVHSRLRAAAIRVAVLACLGLLSLPAAAFASCPASTLSAPFSQWGDNNSYFLIPGGSFEGTDDQVGWSLSGASLTPGNEPFYVNDPSDVQSLTIAGGGTATSPYFCIDNTMQSLRLFAQQASAGGDLQVNALVQTWHGVKTVSLADLTDGSMSTWAPTAVIPRASGIPNWQTVNVALQFSVPASAASWQIDDVYVDPFRSG
jgi:hypothetical protein